MVLQRVTLLPMPAWAWLALLMLSAPPLAAQDTWYAAYELALEEISTGRWDEAIKHLEQALRLKPEPELNARTYGVWRKNYLPFYHLGLAYYNLGRYEKALEYFDRSLAAGAVKNNPKAFQLLNSYQKAIAEQLSSSTHEQEMAARIAEELDNGLELERQGKLREAVVKFESVLTLAPDHREAAAHLERIKRKLQLQEAQAKKLRMIENTLTQGRSYLESGDLSEALACFEKVLELQAEHREARNLLEQTRQRLEQLAQQEKLRKQRIQELLEEALRLYQEGSFKEAEIRFNRVLEIDPGNSEAGKYLELITELAEKRRRRQLQSDLLEEASRLIEHDSLISARDLLLRARQLGSTPVADSLFALLEKRFAETERRRKLMDLPRLVLNIPADSTVRSRRPQAIISGTAFDDDGIQRISMIFNGEQRDIFLAPRLDSAPLNASFEEKLTLTEGLNRVHLVVYDGEQKKSSAFRTIFYQPPFWRRPLFIALWMAIFILGGGSYYYYKRNTFHMLLNRFRPRPFEVIAPNPFIVGNPIRSREMFFGREDDFRYVKNKVDNEKYGSLIVMFGERRAGKTSVLYQILGGRLGDDYLPVFIDMQAMAIDNDWEFLERLAEITLEAVKRRDPQCKITGLEDGSKNPYTLFDKFIDKVLASLKGDKLLFLVDEYELIEEKVEENKISKDIFLFLSGLVEHKPGLFLIFAGNHRLQDRIKPYWQPLLQRCDYRNISYLTPNDTRRLITEPVRGKVFYLGSAVRTIMRLTAGQPFYTQLICRNIVEMLNAEKRNYFYNEDIPTVVWEIIDNPPPQMIYFWAGLETREKITLALLAEVAKSENHFPTLGDMVNCLNKFPLPITVEEIKKVCEKMVTREILEQQDSRDAFRFRMDLFRIWIKEEHNLYKVSREIEHQLTA